MKNFRPPVSERVSVWDKSVCGCVWWLCSQSFISWVEQLEKKHGASCVESIVLPVQPEKNVSEIVPPPHFGRYFLFCLFSPRDGHADPLVTGRHDLLLKAAPVLDWVGVPQGTNRGWCGWEMPPHPDKHHH